MDGYLGVLGFYLFPSFDFSSYGLKDWLQIAAAVVGIVGWTYGAWKAFRYSKGQIAKRLLEYLDTHEKNVVEVAERVIQHLRYGRPIEDSGRISLHQAIDSAVKLVDRDQPRQAENPLENLALLLVQSAKVGERHREIANQQAAVIFVIMGVIAKGRGEIGSARIAWTRALEHNPRDAEAIRGLAELQLADGRGREALRQLEQATEIAPENKRLRAEVSDTKATFFRGRGNPLLELRALHDSALHFEEIREHRPAGQAYEKAAEIEGRRGRINQVRLTLRKAYNSYYMAKDHTGAKRVHGRLSDMGEDLSDLPVLDEPSKWPSIPWPWVRLALEVLILGAAVYVTFMR